MFAFWIINVMHASSQFEGFIKMERLSNMEIINNNVSRLCERYMRSYKIALISLTQDRLEDWFPQAVFISFCLAVVLKVFSEVLLHKEFTFWSRK